VITLAEASFIIVQALHFEQVKKAGAISYETRKSSQEIGLTEKQLDTLVSLGMAKKTEDGKYYAVCYDVESKLRKRGALSPETAVKPEQAGITGKLQSLWLKVLIDQSKVGRTEDDKVWWKG